MVDGISVERKPFLPSLPPSPFPRLSPQGIAEQVKPEHGEEDGQAGEDTCPRRPGDMPRRGGRQHAAPTGDIRGHAHPQKAQKCLGRVLACIESVPGVTTAARSAKAPASSPAED